MSNYARGLAVGVNGEEFQNCPPPYIALEQYHSENAVASSVVSLHPDSSSIEIGAVGGQGVVVRWVPVTETASVAPRGSVIASGLGANFDHFIPTGMYRRFVVPKETRGLSTPGQVGSVNGLYQRLAWINAGPTASSVIASEF